MTPLLQGAQVHLGIQPMKLQWNKTNVCKITLWPIIPRFVETGFVQANILPMYTCLSPCVRVCVQIHTHTTGGWVEALQKIVPSLRFSDEKCLISVER